MKHFKSLRKGEFSLISILGMLFGSILIVGAAVINSTDNLSADLELNDSFPNISILNDSIIGNSTNDSIIGNATFLNESLNLTLTNESASINQTINLTIENQSTNNKPRLAKLFKEDELDFDRKSRLEYLEKHGNFSKIKFKKINGKEEFKLKAGAKQDKIRGISVNNESFAIDLLYCEKSGKYCAFRVNGVPIAKIHSHEESEKNKQTSFELDKSHVLKVNSIKFNQCDNKRFCHFGYEGYDVVNVSIESNDGKK